MSWKRYDVNKYGTPISVHDCDTCGREFMLCPDVSPDSPNWGSCLAETCDSYDPSRDADVFFMSDEEIMAKPIVTAEMFEKAERGPEGTP